MVKAITFHSDDPSSNPAEVSSFFLFINCLKRTINKRRSRRDWPILKHSFSALRSVCSRSLLQIDVFISICFSQFFLLFSQFDDKSTRNIVVVSVIQIMKIVHK